MKRAIDDGCDPLFGIVMDDSVFENGFAGSWFAENETKAALLGMDVDDVEVALLVRKKGLFFVDEKGILGNAEVRADHDFEGW